ncbi:MAG: ABC transporter substrate-binding protein [Ancrocorticia sp.]
MKRFMIATAAALTLALSACTGGTVDKEADGSGSAAADATPITFGLTFIPNIQFAPVYVAEHEGYFEDAGLDVTIRHHGAQEALLGALQSGEEQIVFAGGDEMLQGRAAGVDVVNWATMYQKYPVTLIVPEDSDIQTPDDLKGKTVGLPGPYGENYFALLAMFKAHGLSESDVTVQYIGYTQAAALASGEVDAIIGFSNSDLVNIASARGVDFSGYVAGQDGDVSSWPVRSIDMVDGGLPLVGVGLGSLGSTMEKNRDSYAAVLEALDRAVQFSLENPEKVLDITAAYVPDLAEAEKRAIAAVTLDQTLKLYTGAEKFGAQDADRWDEMVAFMWDNELLEKEVPATEAFVDLTK